MGPEYAIRPMEPADLPELVRLHGEYLNYGEGIQAHFEAALRDPANVAVKCVYEGAMVGLDIHTRGVALSGGHADLCAQVQALAGAATVYTGDALLVVPEHRGRGLDGEMLALSRRMMAQRGAQYVLYELWVHPDGLMPAHKTVDAYRHVMDLGLHRDFYVDFDHYGYYCPICGEKCRCSAHLYLCRI